MHNNYILNDLIVQPAVKQATSYARFRPNKSMQPLWSLTWTLEYMRSILTISLTAVIVNIGLYQLDIFNMPFELALGTFMCHFVSACMVCHTSREKNISKFVFENSRFQIAEAFQSLLCDCRGCKQIAHVLGNDCDIVFISLKSTGNVQRVTLSCSCCFTDTVTKGLVAVKW